MATHSSVLTWRIPGTEEPSRRPSLGSHRVGHDWSDLVAAAAAAGLPLSELLQGVGSKEVKWFAQWHRWSFGSTRASKQASISLRYYFITNFQSWFFFFKVGISCNGVRWQSIDVYTRFMSFRIIDYMYVDKARKFDVYMYNWIT